MLGSVWCGGPDRFRTRVPSAQSGYKGCHPRLNRFVHIICVRYLELHRPLKFPRYLKGGVAADMALFAAADPARVPCRLACREGGYQDAKACLLLPDRKERASWGIEGNKR